MHPATIITLCLMLSAFFSGLEIAFLSANRLRLELDKKHGLFSSRIISIFIDNPSRFIATMLIGNNIVLVIYGIVTARLLQPYILQLISAEYSVLIIQTIISTFFIIVTAEFLPKAIFRQMPNAMLNIFSIPCLIIYILFFPVTSFVISISHFLLRRAYKSKSYDNREMYVFSKIDLDHFIKESSGNEDAINLDDQEIRIFRNALDFSKIKIRDCMLQRTDIAAVEDHDSIEKVKQQFIITRYSKLLVYHENIDNIIGYIKYKDLFKNPRSIDPLIRSLPVVPETMNANKLLRELLLERKGLALVVDEFGGTSGIITIEDILEEIFGEIMDEHDTDEIIEKMLSNDTYIFSGKIPIDYIRKKYHINIAESDEYDTLAGYLIHSLGRIPLQDETFDLGDFSGKIIRAGKTRIELINVKVT